MATHTDPCTQRTAASRTLSTVVRAVPPAVQADRAFKVLRPSRAGTQLSLFPPPGLAPRSTA